MRMLLQWNKVYGIIQTMVIVNILALILLVLLIADRMETSMVRAWPIGVGVLMMVLYGLSFLGALKWIDLLGVLFLLTGSVYFWRKDRKLCMGKVCRKICEPSFLVALLFVILISVLVNDKCVSWWDEINFWAADVKSIFYRNGFAAKYENVAPEFGDYPPGTQLIKWWFLHMNPKAFDEGLMFAGYYFLIFSFLVPSLDRIKMKQKVGQVFAMIGWCILLWLFPTTVEAFWVEGSCADLSMAVIYGAFLVEIVSNRPKKYAFVPGLYLSCMSLCKNTSFIWLAFAGVFLLIYIQFIGEKKTFEMLVFKTGNRLMQTLIILAIATRICPMLWKIPPATLTKRRLKLVYFFRTNMAIKLSIPPAMENISAAVLPKVKLTSRILTILRAKASKALNRYKAIRTTRLVSPNLMPGIGKKYGICISTQESTKASAMSNPLSAIFFE